MLQSGPVEAEGIQVVEQEDSLQRAIRAVRAIGL
jgi:hypothetical protein